MSVSCKTTSIHQSQSSVSCIVGNLAHTTGNQTVARSIELDAPSDAESIIRVEWRPLSVEQGMSRASGALQAAGLLLVAVLSILFWRRYLSPLRDTQGPFAASPTRLWHVKRILKGD